MSNPPSGNEPVYLKELISKALAAGRDEAIPSLARDLAQTAATQFDVFNQVVDMLAYHSQSAVVAEMMQQAWPLVKESSDIVGRGMDDFAARATDMIIFSALEEQTVAEIDVPALQAKLEPFFAIDGDGLTRYLDYLAGRKQTHWTSDSFDFKEQKQEASQNLSTLMIEFLAYLHRQEGISYSKGDLARRQIPDYLVSRRTGQLEPRTDMAAVLRGQQPPPRFRPPAHPLCPDQQTLARYLARLLHFAQPQPYKAAATFELMPPWLRFLESRGLIDATRRQETLDELQGMVDDLHKAWQEYPEDRALQTSTKQWRENARLKTE